MSTPNSQPNPPQDDNRRLAEHDSIPVRIESEIDQGAPADWDWRIIGSSQPNAATFHINHSDVTQVKVDALRPEDSPPDSPFVITGDIPILIIDTLDQFWAGESRTRLPLQGLRVPVAGDTEREAKQKLAADLAAQLRLLLLLSTSRQGNIAPELRANLLYLSSVLEARTR
jgi:hypothetical protein